MTLCPLAIEVTDKRFGGGYFYTCHYLPQVAFYCALAGKVVASLKKTEKSRLRPPQVP